MTPEEMSNMFDVLYDNITSKQAPGLNEYEKSVFLTKAQDEIIKNYFEADSKGNNTKKGFDDSIIRQSDFATLMCSQTLDADGVPTFDPRALVYQLPDFKKLYLIINEQLLLMGNSGKSYYKYNASTKTWDTYNKPKEELIFSQYSVNEIEDLPKEASDGVAYEVRNTYSLKGIRTVVPIKYDEYMTKMSKPFKEPLKWQAWRLITNTGNTTVNKTDIEIVVTSHDKTLYPKIRYSIRYVKRPMPIILVDLSDSFGEDLSIDGYKGNEEFYTTKKCCELGEGTHQAIVQRAVELARIAWGGDANQTQLDMTAGQRSE